MGTTRPKPSAQATLTTRALNRATLARQLLLAKEKAPLVAAVERIGGLQAQLARPPFIGLWSRVQGFARADLCEALHARQLVRAPMMRCTLHVVSAKDFVALRPGLQDSFTRAMKTTLRGRSQGLEKDVELDGVVKAARAFLKKGPCDFDVLRDHLAGLFPGADPRSMGYVVRTQLPLVQVPVADTDWGFPGTTDFALADAWLGKPLRSDDDDARALVRRYLAAFGPATAKDAQAWSGLGSLAATMEALRPELVTFRDEKKRELFDLPDAPRPPEDAPAPPRFLPEFDSLILGHDDRARLIDDAHRPLIYLSKNLRVLATFLVDGKVAGTWRVERKRKVATLSLAPFAALHKKAREALTVEGEALLRFVEEDATELEVTVG